MGHSQVPTSWPNFELYHTVPVLVCLSFALKRFWSIILASGAAYHQRDRCNPAFSTTSVPETLSSSSHMWESCTINRPIWVTILTHHFPFLRRAPWLIHSSMKNWRFLSVLGFHEGTLPSLKSQSLHSCEYLHYSYTVREEDGDQSLTKCTYLWLLDDGLVLAADE